jgi:hypothetical protein
MKGSRIEVNGNEMFVHWGSKLLRGSILKSPLDKKEMFKISLGNSSGRRLAETSRPSLRKLNTARFSFGIGTDFCVFG